MLYRNIRTGAEFDSPCPISGEDWIPVPPENNTVSAGRGKGFDFDLLVVDEEYAGKAKQEEINLSEMTVAQLKEYALENEIDIGKATKKADIIKAISG
jgi:hypothetical protein